MSEEKSVELVVYIDTDQKENAMLPWAFLYFINRWSSRHDIKIEAKLETKGDRTAIRIKEWPTVFEEALHIFSNCISNDDVELYILECNLEDLEPDEDEGEDISWIDDEWCGEEGDED